jgi:hypothetical protein
MGGVATLSHRQSPLWSPSVLVVVVPPVCCSRRYCRLIPVLVVGHR